MWKRRRINIWISVLLAGALSVSGKNAVQANATSELSDFSQKVLSFNMVGETELSQYEDEVWENDISDNNNLVNLEVVSENCVLNLENVDVEMISDNKMEEQSHNTNLSDNVLPSSDSISDADAAVSENQGIEQPVENDEPLDVILPTDIPFDIVLLGEDGDDALIKSQQYCIENKSYADVRLSLEGVCYGNTTEDYVVSERSVKDNFVQGKKNIWLYLQWEDKERKILEQPGIVMGGVSNPGKGEIILKAPKRNEDGEVIGENIASKVYFSLTGDMKSDMEQSWGDGEVKVDLRFTMKADKSENPNMLESLEENEELLDEDEKVNMLF